MRPLRLTLDGFRSYASATTFDFAHRRLVGVVGPIGAGKSSILDGIAFALYGKTHSQAAATKALIHQRSDVGKVELVFEAGDEVWRVVRALRKDGQSEHAAYRYANLAAIEAESKPLERIVKKGAVDERLEEVLGLDFAAFGRSVMLAQNRFAEFLRAKPADRDVVLKGVFGFDRIDLMQTEARRRRDELARDLQEIDRRRKDLDHERALLAEAEQKKVLAAERHDQLEAIGPSVAEAIAEKTAAAQDGEACRQQIANLDALALRLPADDESAELLSRAGDLNAAVAAAADATADAEKLEAEAHAAIELALQRIGGRDRLAEAQELAGVVAQQMEAARLEQERYRVTRGELSAADEAMAATAINLESASSEVEASQATVGTAHDAFEAATADLRATESADVAATLRSKLSAGDECPVCHQHVAEVPASEAPGLDEARKRYEAAHAEVDQARQTHKKLEVELARVEAAMSAAVESQKRASQRNENAKESAERLKSTSDATRASLLGLLDGVDLAKFEAELATLEGEVRSAAQQSAAQRAAQAELIRTRASTDRRLERLVGQLHAVCGALGIELDIGGEPAEIGEALAAIRAEWTNTRGRAASAAAETVAHLQAAEARRQDLLASVNLTVDSDHTTALSDAKAMLAARATEVETRTQRLAGSDDLAVKQASSLAEREIYTQLASDLTPSNFLRFLLEEERRLLSRLGSARFEELSGGRYRFSDDGRFRVIDLTAAEQIRKADTLSGGETFLASLALALALAETVGRGGGRLDAFFLDEGFGSLDSEHLDLAMAGIERLVAEHEGRLVVVVSHVPDMKDRLEDLIELDKDPATGATVVRRA